MTARPAVRALLAGALVAAALVACTLDWEVRPDPAPVAEAGADVVAPATEAGADVMTPVVDAAPGKDADCTTLAADVEDKKAKARVCTLAPGECQQTVKDACDCDVVVTNAGASATSDYVAAVAAFKAKCKATCKPTCPPTFGHACLQSGVKIECYP
jgi:hypothetical protein